MYSELIRLKIINPETGHHRDYIIDYNGNKDIEEIKEDVIEYIEKHKTFYTDEFAKECLNDMSNIYYLEDVEVIIVDIKKEVMDLSEL